MEGLIFNIQRFSIHDGPGIRTTVFLKGCPLSCWWCHNPESKSFNQGLILSATKCIKCGRCIMACSKKALELKDEGININHKLCNNCLLCEGFCPSGAIEIAGRRITTDEAMEELQKDMIFYEESGGGVTFSGGEPLAQAAFLEELLIKCRNKGIHTAVDTSGFAPWETLFSISKHTNIFLFDIKHIDDEVHMKYTGKSNKLILDNLVRLTEIHSRVHIRIPIVPSINDDIFTHEAISSFLRKLSITEVYLLPYHDIGIYKYAGIGEEYLLKEIKPLAAEDLSKLQMLYKQKGLNVKIGG